MKKHITTIKKYVFAHKLISGIAAVLLLGVAWFGISALTAPKTQTLYVLGTAMRATVISTVSGSGQVSASRQLDVKPEVSGKIVYVGVKPGQSVAQGALLAQIDSTDAQKALRDAKNNLETAKLALEKLTKPASGLTLIQAQNAAANAKDTLAKNYITSGSDIVNVFLDMPDIMTSLQDMVIGTTASHGTQWNIDFYQNAIASYEDKSLAYRNAAYDAYVKAKASYDTAFADYKAMGNAPDEATIEKMSAETYTMLTDVSNAEKSINAFLGLYTNSTTNRSQTPSSVATAAVTKLATHINDTSSALSTILADTNSIKTAKQSVVEKQQSLLDITDGADPLDVRSDELTVQQREDAVLDAQNTLAKYYIRAPFAGTVASVDAYVGDQAAGTALLSIITKQQIATLSLNEVDAAKVSAGNKATLTFDAIDGLTLTGQVVQVDAVGTVSQGVVSYEVQIAFDTQDARIKPGMTANAAIQTALKQDVLTVPSSAVKTQNGTSYVQVFTPALTDVGGIAGTPSSVSPTRVEVEVGISDDTNVEIISGITEGQQIVTRTTSSAAKTTTTTTSTNRTGGGFGAGPAIRL